MNKFFCRYPATAFLFILLFCIVGLLMNGCSKKDQNEKQVAEIKPASASTFFTVSSSTDPLVTAIAASLRRQDSKGDIQSQLSRHAGLPKWDHAMVATGTTIVAGKGETGREDSVKIALIPFVQENYVQTNAMLMIKISSTDTLYRLIYAGQYAEFGFGKAETGKWNAFNLFHLFTRFDNAIFGHKKFLVKDKRILAGLGVKNQETATVELVSDKAVASRLVRVPYCTDYDVCVKPCAAKLTAARAQACCLEWATRSFCTEIWIDDGNPAPAPPGGSTPSLPGSGFPGGGSGSGGGIPVVDPCDIDPNLGTPDHLCFEPDGGWQPVPIKDDNLNSGVGVFDNFIVTGDDLNKINSWVANNIDTSGLDNCRKVLLNKLINNLGTSSLGIFLSKLDNALGIPNTIDKFKLHFITEPLHSYNAITMRDSYDEVSKEFEVDIILDSSTSKNATDIFIANTLLHEIIHAYMTFIWKKLNAGASQEEMANLKYDQVFNAYVDTLGIRQSLNPQPGSTPIESIQHNYMADQLLEFMASIVKQFDNNPTTTDRYYWYLAWSGLTRKQVRTWQQAWPNFPGWPPSNPAPTEDSTRGLKYALTLTRIDSIYNKVLENEEKSLPGARGRKPVPGGCY